VGHIDDRAGGGDRPALCRILRLLSTSRTRLHYDYRIPRRTDGYSGAGPIRTSRTSGTFGRSRRTGALWSSRSFGRSWRTGDTRAIRPFGNDRNGRSRRADDDNLVLPHPRAFERAFVLQPWYDIEPDAVLPDHGPIVDLLEKTDRSGLKLREDASLQIQ